MLYVYENILFFFYFVVDGLYLYAIDIVANVRTCDGDYKILK